MTDQYSTLKEWVELCRHTGDVVQVSGIHWDREMGVLAQLARRQHQGPAFLFDRIPDCEAGHRVLVNTLGSTRRLALTLRLDQASDHRDLCAKWKAKWKELKLIPSQRVKDGSVLQNRLAGGDVDLGRFPAPRWHEQDGGRYLGTGCVVILRDPDSGWVNLGTYRIQLQGRQEVTCFIGATHHGSMIREKYARRGESCPVAIVLGADPLLLLCAGSMGVPPNQSEYEYAGGIRGEAIPVVEGEFSGLPIPAEAEVVLEGQFDFTERKTEGPFGEFTGYYASGRREEALVHVKGISYSSEPILLGSPPTRPPNESTFIQSILLSGSLEEELKGAGIPNVEAVWCHEVGAARMFIVVAIKQGYPGHAKQALVAASNTYTGILSKIVIVVDDDVDVTDLEEVMWAVCTRIDPARDVEILRRCPSNYLDPAVAPGQPTMTSRLLIDGTRPYEWRERFAPVISLDREAELKVRETWGRLLALDKMRDLNMNKAGS
jgi:UbiD family decarboxylase